MGKYFEYYPASKSVWLKRHFFFWSCFFLSTLMRRCATAFRNVFWDRSNCKLWYLQCAIVDMQVLCDCSMEVTNLWYQLMRKILYRGGVKKIDLHWATEDTRNGYEEHNITYSWSSDVTVQKLNFTFCLNVKIWNKLVKKQASFCVGRHNNIYVNRNMIWPHVRRSGKPKQPLNVLFGVD